jgi:hypothetical protein
MPKEWPREREGCEHDAAKAGVGVNDAALSGDKREMKLRRPDSEEKHVSRRGRAFNFDQPGFRWELGEGSGAAVAKRVTRGNFDSVPNLCQRRSDKPEAVEPSQWIATVESKLRANVAFRSACERCAAHVCLAG